MLGLNGGLLGAVRTSRRGSAVGSWTLNEQIEYQRDGFWIGDSNFDNTTLLLHMDGSNGSTIFVDSSKSAVALTVNGTAQINSATSAFNSTSASFLSSGAYISISNITGFTFGSGDFTVEAWFYPLSPTTNPYSTEQLIAGIWSATAPGAQAWALWLSNGAIVFIADIITNDNVLFNVSAVTQQRWYHVAVSRKGTTAYLFIDGLLRGTSSVGTSAITTGSNTFGVGGYNRGSGGNATFNGYLDEIRVTKSFGRYDTTFPVPLREFSDKNSYEDPNFSLVSLLLHMDGLNNNTSFIDSSINKIAVTTNGNAKISTAQSKFGGASGLFDGTTDWVYAGSDCCAFGTGDFTIECWVRWTTLTDAGIFHAYSGTPPSVLTGLGLGWQSNNFVIYANGVGVNRAFTPTTGVWYHVAFVRSSGVLGFYLDGALQGATIADTTNYTGYGVNIGLYYSSAYTINGHIDEFRVTKGLARYTSNFTPSSQAFPDVTSYTSTYIDPYFNSVSLLMHMNGGNGSTSFVDSSINNLAITAAGNAQISTAQSYFGGASALFDGNGDYLQITSSTLFDFPGDFTIECWVKTISNSANQGIVVRRVLDTSGTGTWGLQINNGVATFSNLQTITNTTFGTVTINAWTHIAVSRVGSSIRLYLNGALNATVTDSTSFSNTQNLFIGAWGRTGAGSVPTVGWFNGYIDEFRITKGIGRYPGFSLPTKPYPNA